MLGYYSITREGESDSLSSRYSKRYPEVPCNVNIQDLQFGGAL